jgi:hypothetical protein
VSNKAPTTFVYALLTCRIMPSDRGQRYEDPLNEALRAKGLGQVTGGGTMQAKGGEIDYCGLDIELVEVTRDIPFVCDFLANCGAPKGSRLEYTEGERKIDVPFGILEGLAIYLNGTDLPDEVYRTSDINIVYKDINRLLGNRGDIQGHWEGPRETALYAYGYSAEEMRSLLDAYLKATPLCQRARVVQIA